MNSRDKRTKCQKLRQQIRHKQIEEYKQKIRNNLKTQHHHSPSSDHDHDHDHDMHNINMNMCSLEQLSHKYGNKNTNKNKNKDYRYIQQRIWQIKQELKQFDNVFNNNDQFDNRMQLELQQRKNQYRGQVDQIISEFLDVYDANFEENQAQVQTNMMRVLPLLELISNQSKVGTKLWNIQQRCILSDIMRKTLKKSLHTPPHISTSILKLSITYINSLLQKQIQKLHQSRKSSPTVPTSTSTSININEIQQQILHLIVQNYLIMKIYRKQHSFMGCQYQNQLLREDIAIVWDIIRLYSQYLVQYREELEGRVVKQNFNMGEWEYEEIGNVNMQVIKQVIKIGVQTISQYWQHSTLESPKNTPHIINTHNEIKLYCNTLCVLISQFCIVLTYCQYKQIQHIQKLNCTNLSQTLLTTIACLIEFILNVVQSIQEEQMAVLGGLGDSGKSARWFLDIRNKQLIGSILQLISTNIYGYTELQQIHNSTPLKTYILSCIFTDIQPSQDSPNSSSHRQTSTGYSQFRQQKLRQNQKIQTEIECLKLIQILNKKGINLDEEGNLQLRYTMKIGDGKVNKFYFDHFCACIL